MIILIILQSFFVTIEIAWSVIDLSVYDKLTNSAAVFAYPNCLIAEEDVAPELTRAQLARNSEKSKIKEKNL